MTGRHVLAVTKPPPPFARCPQSRAGRTSCGHPGPAEHTLYITSPACVRERPGRRPVGGLYETTKRRVAIAVDLGGSQLAALAPDTDCDAGLRRQLGLTPSHRHRCVIASPCALCGSARRPSQVSRSGCSIAYVGPQSQPYVHAVAIRLGPPLRSPAALISTRKGRYATPRQGEHKLAAQPKPRQQGPQPTSCHAKAATKEAHSLNTFTGAVVNPFPRGHTLPLGAEVGCRAELRPLRGLELGALAEHRNGAVIPGGRVATAISRS